MSHADDLVRVGYELGPDFVNVETHSPYEAAYEKARVEAVERRYRRLKEWAEDPRKWRPPPGIRGL